MFESIAIADCAFKWLARVLGLRRPELPTRRQTVGQKRHTEEDRRTGREEGATGRMQCANGHDLDPCLGADSGGIWGWAQVRATVAAAEASSVRRLRYCDYDVCTSCYEEEVGTVGA